MDNKDEKQIRHEKLVEFLSIFPQYQIEGKPRLQKVSPARGADKLASISTNDINIAVVAFMDVLNLISGSNGEVDLYRLMQAYLTVPEYRAKIDAIVEEAHTFRYEKAKA